MSDRKRRADNQPTSKRVVKSAKTEQDMTPSDSLTNVQFTRVFVKVEDQAEFPDDGQLYRHFNEVVELLRLGYCRITEGESSVLGVNRVEKYWSTAVTPHPNYRVPKSQANRVSREFGFPHDAYTLLFMSE